MKGATGLRFAAWIIAITLVALPVVGVLQGWFASDRWPVRELQVHATFSHVSAAQVRTAVASSLGAGFFAIDLEKVRDAVAALPWVSRVEVSKHWPDALDITITEIDPVAHWGSDSLLGRDGRIFKVPNAGVVNGLPQFNAPDDRVADVLAFYRTAQIDFAPYSLRVTGVDLSARGGWSLTLSNDGHVTVGDAQPDQRLARFVAALPILMRGRSDGFIYADLRYSNGFAVRWPDVPATPAPTKPANGEPPMLLTETFRPMTRKSDKNLVVGLDIGTSKVMAIVGEYVPGEPIEVIGVGSHTSRGMKKGVVVEIESNVNSIQRAVEEAGQMAGCDIRSVCASISGSHLETHNSRGTAAIRDREVAAGDLDQVLESASAVAIPADRKVLYKEPQEYRIDGQDGIRHPVGMSGVRLEAGVHLVTGAASAVQNITKCIQRCGLAVDDLVPSAVASAKSVLTDDERELGVCVVDLGAGTTDIAIFTHGSIRYTKSLPVGGDQVTSDISQYVQTPTTNAEEIKVKYGCALAQLARGEETIQVPSVGERPPRRLQRQALAQSIQARYEEIFEMVQDEMRRSGYENLLAAGVVLTGGAARIEGALYLAEEVFHKMVRLGVPQHVTGVTEVIATPANAAGVGLLLQGSQSHGGGGRVIGGAMGDSVAGFIGKARGWLHKNF